MAKRGPKPRPLADRLWAKVTPDDAGCLLWCGAVNAQGYGQISAPGGRGAGLLYVHRVAWELAHGPIPDRLQIDHRCRVTRCVNVLHLEPVTQGENIRRGYAHSRATGTGRYRTSPTPTGSGEQD